jgi:hypothetical protein
VGDEVIETLKPEPRHTSYGAGIYELGTNGLRVFVTMGGRVIAVQGRALCEDDLIEAYRWGRLEQEALWAQRDDSTPQPPEEEGEL